MNKNQQKDNFVNLLLEKKLLSLVILIGPALIFLIYITAFYNPIDNLKHVPIAIVDLDQSEESAKVIRKILEDSHYNFTIISYLDDLNTLKNKYYGIIVLPSNFSENLKNFHSANIIGIAFDHKNYLIYRTFYSYLKVLNDRLKFEIEKEMMNKTQREIKKFALMNYKLSRNLNTIYKVNGEISEHLNDISLRLTLISNYPHLKFLGQFSKNILLINEYLSKSNFGLARISDYVGKLEFMYKDRSNFISKPFSLKINESGLNYGKYFVAVFLALTLFLAAISNVLFIGNLDANTTLLFRVFVSVIFGLFQSFIFLIFSSIILSFNNVSIILSVFVILFFILFMDILLVYIIAFLLHIFTGKIIKNDKITDQGVKLLYPLLSFLAIFLLVSSGGIWPPETLFKFYAFVSKINLFNYQMESLKHILFDHYIMSNQLIWISLLIGAVFYCMLLLIHNRSIDLYEN